MPRMSLPKKGACIVLLGAAANMRVHAIKVQLHSSMQTIIVWLMNLCRNLGLPPANFHTNTNTCLRSCPELWLPALFY